MSRALELIADFMSYRLSQHYPESWLNSHRHDLARLGFLEGLSNRDVDRWLSVPLGYLSESEALIVGVTKYFSTAREGAQGAHNYFEVVALSSDQRLKSLGNFALGVLKLEEALKSQSRDHFKQSEQLFQSAIAHHPDCQYSRLALVITLVAQGHWIQVPKVLVQLSRRHCRPALIYQVLAGIYEKIGLAGPHEFYQLKAKKAENSFGLFFETVI